MRLLLLCLTACLVNTYALDAPKHLLSDFHRSPALGVSSAPQFSWVVSHISGDSNSVCDATNQLQTAHQIQVSLSTNFITRLVWDSGVVASGESHRVSYAGPQLLPGARYWWRVRTWSSSSCQSAWSYPR